MAQKYTQPLAKERMAKGLCPECGEPAGHHIADSRFWIPRRCDILPLGVIERIDQYLSTLDTTSG